MRTLDFVVKELSRRKMKLIAGILSVILGIGIFVAAQTTDEALYGKVKGQLLRFGANIMVQSKDEPFDAYFGSGLGSAFLPEGYVDLIQEIEHHEMLVALSPTLYERFMVGNTNLLVVGITEDEMKAKPWWMINRRVVADEFPENKQVLLGHYAAAHLGPVPQIELENEMFMVTGVLDETGSADDFAAFVPLHVLQDLVGKERMVNVIEVSTSCIACSEMNVYDIATEIDEALPDDARAIPIKQITEAQIGTLTKVENFIFIISVIVLGLSVFLVMNYMFSSVSERRHEIGILLAIGMDARTIYKFFVLKALILGTIGGFIGYALGTVSSMVAGPHIAGTSVPPLPGLLPYSITIAIVICIVSSILPARRAAQLDPVEALREV